MPDMLLATVPDGLMRRGLSVDDLGSTKGRALYLSYNVKRNFEIFAPFPLAMSVGWSGAWWYG